MQWLKNNVKLVGVVGVILLFLFYFIGKDHEAAPEEFQNLSQGLSMESEESEEAVRTVDSEENQTMFVDIKGEVKHPGVLEVSGEKRVDDVIQLAGGFTEKANKEAINLAQKVSDEMVIIVPAKGEQSSVEGVVASSTSQGGKIKINSASKEELEQLNGIGSKKADAIIEYRDTSGNLQEVDELLEISGIGEKTLENIKEAIQVP